jgi:hypothetical protein
MVLLLGNSTEEIKYGSILFKDQLVTSEKYYKSTMDLAIKNHTASLMEKIQNLRASNPREYWRMIKQKTNPKNLKIL